MGPSTGATVPAGPWSTAARSPRCEPTDSRAPSGRTARRKSTDAGSAAA